MNTRCDGYNIVFPPFLLFCPATCVSPSSLKVKGIEKLGGRVELKSHVEQIVVEGGRAVGVKLRSGAVIRARKAVVSNASIWDTIGYGTEVLRYSCGREGVAHGNVGIVLGICTSVCGVRVLE